MKTILSIFFIVGCIGTWYYIKKDKNKKLRSYYFLLTIISLLMIVVLVVKEAHVTEIQNKLSIKLPKKNDYSLDSYFETDSKGKVIISGTTLASAEVTLIPDDDARHDGFKKQKAVADSKGNFKFKVNLSDKYGREEFLLKASSKGLDTEQLDVTVFNNSKVYEENQKQIKNQEKAEEAKRKADTEAKKNQENDTSVISPKVYNEEQAEHTYQEALNSADMEKYLKDPNNIGKSIIFRNAKVAEASHGQNLWISTSSDPNEVNQTNFQSINIVNSKVVSGKIVEIHGVIVPPHKSIIYDYNDGLKYPTIDCKEITIKN